MTTSMQTWAKTLKSTLQKQEAAMLEMLYAFCAINSGSHHLQGLAHMHDALTSAFTPLTDNIETHPLPPVSTINLRGKEAHDGVGALLYLRKRPHLTRRVLLSGHMDTVFGKHHPFQTITAPKPGILKGPGVADMKGGLIVILHALQAFETTPAANSIGWDVVISADEELGSPASREFFKKIRHRYQAALVYEPAVNTEGGFARSRKGSGKFTLIAHGKTAHAGRAFNKGKNAIAYLSEVLVAVNDFNKNDRHITFNIGEIAGGQALNIVPDTAVAKLDIRTSQPDDEAWVHKQFQQLIKQFKRHGYELTLHGSFGRPVKQINPASEALFKRLKAIGKLQGKTFSWQDTGGCCDGNNLAEEGLAVIDTLGVRGGNIHSAEEFLVTESLVERAQLTALLLIDLAEGGLETLSPH
ncbi:MAG: hydrolase [Legionellaceae bacterium]|nr:hydrolase [Legionellaceae bacterium]